MTSTRSYLITGGTSGIGEAVARHLSTAGHKVWVIGTRVETVNAAITGGFAVGGSVADVSDAAEVERAFVDAVAAMGGLDGVFLNAGVDGEGKPAEQLDPATFARVLSVNTVGVLVTAQAAFRHLDRPGTIVVNSSANALRPESHFADYNASKAAAASIGATLALEWSGQGLSITTICPGYFPSRMTAPFLNDPETAKKLLAGIPSGRFGEASDIGALVEFLLGPHSSYLTGSTISIDGGRVI
jgi:NAD(P)-dependent dehydrogenase (short-subunit alcohol dehydrogenase family)